MSDPTAYPLTWPTGRPRTPLQNRKRAQFKTRRETGWMGDVSVAVGTERVLRELASFGARYPLISSDVELRRDGLPRSDRRDPIDPGVAVYFTKDAKPYCLACDTFDRVADNLAAIAGHIEATRRQLRYGVATAEESLRAFEALPPPGPAPWRAVLGFKDEQPATVDEIRTAHRRLLLDRHPDRPGGSHDAMAEVNAARDRALAEIEASS